MSKRRRKERGPSIQGRFQPIIHAMSESQAFRSLSGAAVKVYIDLRRLYNGGNNGDIRYSLGIGAERLFLGKATVRRALAELVEKGFIRQTGRGGWIGRQAATWRVTDKEYGNHPGTNDWRNWIPSVPIRHPRAACGSNMTPEPGIPESRVPQQYPSGHTNSS